MWLLLGFPSSWKFIWRLTEVMSRFRDRESKPWNPCNPWNAGLNLMTQCLPLSVRAAMQKKAEEMTQSDDNSNQKPDSESHQEDKLSEATTSMPQSRMHKPKAAAFKKKRRTARKKKKNQKVMKKVKATT